VLNQATHKGAGPCPYAALDLMLQLLHYWRRADLISADAPFLAPFDGLNWLIGLGYLALEQGALQLAAHKS